MRTPSSYTPDTALTRNPSLFRLFPLLPTDQFSYLSSGWTLSGRPFSALSESPTHQTLSSSLSLYLSLYARSLNQPYTSAIAKESQGVEKVQVMFYLNKERNPDTTVEKEQPFSILLFSLK